jgi:hypothetical protein
MLAFRCQWAWDKSGARNSPDFWVGLSDLTSQLVEIPHGNSRTVAIDFILNVHSYCIRRIPKVGDIHSLSLVVGHSLSLAVGHIHIVIQV